MPQQPLGVSGAEGIDRHTDLRKEAEPVYQRRSRIEPDQGRTQHIVPGSAEQMQALVDALKKGEIAGAAMDVYEHEPQIHPELLTLDNVVLSPHTGTGTWEGRIAMCENVCDNILAWEKQDFNKMNIVL